MKMPPQLGFSDNLFQSRNDLLQAATSLLTPLEPYKSPCGSRIKVATATGTGFDEISAQLEGYARPLWVVADLLATQSTDQTSSSLNLNSWRRGLDSGVNPNSASCWGQVGDHDQRMVEMEPIAYALLTAPSVFVPTASEGADQDLKNEKRNNILTWLRAINERGVPPSNWRWFRVLVNLALVKAFAVPYEEVKPLLDADFKILDTFYLKHGWSSDGLWAKDKKQVDYYSGSFAMQYSQLAYVRFAHDLDPERVARYRAEAGEFAQTFWRYFDLDGAAIPFGRSLTYRFTFAAFWSAVAVADIPLPPPLDQPGVVKGLLLRHLRWWAKKSDIFNTDGTLNIGYTYPNMFLSEDYNSPQSMYWCMKTFSVLGLSQDHPFWTCKELPHPLSTDSSLGAIGVTIPAVQIVCSTPEHHFLLSAGQFTRKTHRAREAKYSKFAYSSAFGFSVPAGTILAQMAPDSTLCISNDEGESWKARWEPIDARIQDAKLFLESPGERGAESTIPSLISGWRPWKNSDVRIDTILIPSLERYPGWHVRVHKLSWCNQPAEPLLELVDAGFAISCQGSSGSVLPKMNTNLEAHGQTSKVAKEGTFEGDSEVLILSSAGASGVCQISGNESPFSQAAKHTSKGFLLTPDSNTNLMAQRTVIPTIYHHFDTSNASATSVGAEVVNEVYFAIGIFAVTANAGLSGGDVKKLWLDRPQLNIGEYMKML